MCCLVMNAEGELCADKRRHVPRSMASVEVQFQMKKQCKKLSCIMAVHDDQ